MASGKTAMATMRPKRAFWLSENADRQKSSPFCPGRNGF